MKNVIIKHILLILSSTLLLVSCKKEIENTGAMTVKLTDAPGEYAHVNIDIRAVEIHQAGKEDNDGGWTILETHAGIYDLLALQNNVSLVLADHPAISPDKITQIRLILGDSNSLVLKDGRVFSLTIPSGGESGLKINTNISTSIKYTLDVELDFDAGKSIVKNDVGYMLKPVLQITRIGYH
jgi:hypothetical protein